MQVERFRRFKEQHRTGSATVMHLRDGELWYAKKPDGAVAITWLPQRAHHPDAPELVTDSVREGIDSDGDDAALSERLRTYFEKRDPRRLVPVTIEQEASIAELEAVQRVFDDAGMPAAVSANYGRHSLSHPDWIVIAEVQLGVFVAGFVGKAGADAWDALRAFVGRLYEERRRLGHDKGSLMFDEGRRRVVISDALPPEAYPALADLGDAGEYRWDHDARAWRKL